MLEEGNTMQIRITGWAVAWSAAFLLLFGGPGSEAQTAGQTRAGNSRPDLTGIWMLGGGMDAGRSGRRFSLEEPPLQGEALEKYQAARKGTTDPNEGGLDEFDPSYYCFPPGPARSMIMPFPWEIVQTPEVVYILFEFNSGTRRIYLNQQEHPKELDPTWMGHSIGRWDDDTLVAETALLREGPWLDRIGTPYSDALRIIERFWRPGRETLEVEFEFQDPKAFTKPWGGIKQYELQMVGITEYVQCEEHLEMGKSWRDAQEGP
jgi:hypothetical protein